MPSVPSFFFAWVMCDLFCGEATVLTKHMHKKDILAIEIQIIMTQPI